MSVTREPIKTAPPNSNTAAIITAFRSVNTPAPTEVANELAQSFAPIPQALYNAKNNPHINIH